VFFSHERVLRPHDEKPASYAESDQPLGVGLGSPHVGNDRGGRPIPMLRAHFAGIGNGKRAFIQLRRAPPRPTAPARRNGRKAHFATTTGPSASPSSQWTQGLNIGLVITAPPGYVRVPTTCPKPPAGAPCVARRESGPQTRPGVPLVTQLPYELGPSTFLHKIESRSPVGTSGESEIQPSVQSRTRSPKAAIQANCEAAPSSQPRTLQTARQSHPVSDSSRAVPLPGACRRPRQARLRPQRLRLQPGHAGRGDPGTDR
jgi:hypothetical protein